MDWLRAPVRDVIKPFRDSNIEVTREWYPVPRGTPSLGFAHAFGSAHWEPFPYLPRNVGEVFPSQYEFIRKATPNGLNFEHFCGTEEEFQKGAVFNPDLPPRVYNADGIPECCMPSTCNCEQQTLELPAAPTTVITPITGSTVRWSGGGAHLPAMRLPAREAAVIYLLPIDFLAGSARILPPQGERINGQTVNTPIVVGPGTALQGIVRAIRFDPISPLFPGMSWDVRALDALPPVIPPFSGARVPLLANQLCGAGVGTFLTWTTPLYDTSGYWSIANPTRLTIPNGVNRVRLNGCIATLAAGAAANVLLTIRNQAGLDVVNQAASTGFADARLNVTTGVFDVAPGDWFELRVAPSLAKTVVADQRTWFSVEEVKV